MGLPNGVHHLAICTKDIKQQIDYFSQVVGMELVALYWMHGVENTFHGFMKMSDSSSIAFVQHPDVAKIEPIKGVSHAGHTTQNVAAGVMQHLALNVDSLDDLLAIRDRVRSHGHWVMGPLDHGFCKSIYLAAPEGIMLEFSTSEGGSIDAEAWIDPEVMARAGISAAEVEQFKHPAAFESKGGKVAQPKPDPSKPLMDYPLNDRIWSMSDEEVTRRMSETTPPVQKKPKAA
jgi:catechol 2,3-dioxygenase-like lactoylglutathione lyase family enzyme